MSENKYAGKITISRPHSNHTGDSIEIRLNDVTSGELMFIVTLSPEAFALALTGLAMQECVFNLHDVENAGKVKEDITFTLSFQQDAKPTFKEIIAIARAFPYEIDGWRCTLTSMSRYGHEKIGDTWYVQVPFERFVDKVG